MDEIAGNEVRYGMQYDLCHFGGLVNKLRSFILEGVISFIHNHNEYKLRIET